MSFESDANQLAECTHGSALPFGTRAIKRCPHCGAMRVGDGPWALPHLVDAFVRAWKMSRETPS